MDGTSAVAADGFKKLRVLIVDDEKNIRATLAACLEAFGCQADGAATGAEALSLARKITYDLAFLDLRLGTEDGLSLLPELLRENPGLEIVVITAFATVDTAVKAIKLGARDYLQKPFEPSHIRHTVDRVLEMRRMRREIDELKDRLNEASPDADLDSVSPHMRAAFDILKRASASDASVLLKGESGTGKSVFARALHRMSARNSRPFVVVNCPTLTEELLAGELFGHMRGAFTGATKDQPGKVEMAEGGTLFLDEISEMPVGLQAKLLRFIQDKEFERLGENRTRKADVRVVAASNRNLDVEVTSGRFREDLLFRLNVIEISVPPLRDRREDIIPLARKFITFFAAASKRQPPGLSAEAEKLLLGYAWPGNVRELRNAIERALILWPGEILTPSAFPERMTGTPPVGPSLGGDYTLDSVKEEHIRLVSARSRTKEEAARILGIDPSTLWRIMRR